MRLLWCAFKVKTQLLERFTDILKKKLLKVFLKLNNFKKLRITVISFSRWKITQYRSEVRTCTANNAVISFQVRARPVSYNSRVKSNTKTLKCFFTQQTHANHSTKKWRFPYRLFLSQYLNWLLVAHLGSSHFFSFVFSFMFLCGMLLAVRKTLLGFSRKAI